MRNGLLPEWDGIAYRTNPQAGRELLGKTVRSFLIGDRGSRSEKREMAGQIGQAGDPAGATLVSIEMN
jgi:hypothetical protein